MSKVKAEILGGVNLGDGTIYTPGMEDELAKAITPAQVEHLTAQGAITGFDAKADKAAAKEEAAKEAAAEAETATAPTAKEEPKAAVKETAKETAKPK